MRDKIASSFKIKPLSIGLLHSPYLLRGQTILDLDDRGIRRGIVVDIKLGLY